MGRPLLEPPKRASSVTGPGFLIQRPLVFSTPILGDLSSTESGAKQAPFLWYSLSIWSRVRILCQWYLSGTLAFPAPCFLWSYLGHAYICLSGPDLSAVTNPLRSLRHLSPFPEVYLLSTVLFLKSVELLPGPASFGSAHLVHVCHKPTSYHGIPSALGSTRTQSM